MTAPHLGLDRRLCEGKRRVEGIEFATIRVWFVGRVRSAVAAIAEVVRSLDSLRRLPAGRDRRRRGWNIPDELVEPDLTSGINRVRIIHDQYQRFRLRRDVRDRQRRVDVLCLTAILLGNRSAVSEGRAGEL